MSFNHIEKKGLNDFLMDAGLAPERLSLHISELPAGKSSHDPHAHGGVEAYYVFQGEVTLSLAGEAPLRLTANEAACIDSGTPHQVTNTGGATNRYMVIIVRPPA